MKIEDITRGTFARPRICLLYGVAGIGKSTWASEAPGAVFIPTEDGTADIDCARFPLCESVAEVVAAHKALFDGKHEHRTCIVDSGDSLERQIFAQVCRDKGVESMSEIDWGKGWAAALDYWELFVAGWRKLRDERRMNVIILAHETIKTFRDPMGASYDRYRPRLREDAAAMVVDHCDEVFFATYDVRTRTEDAGFRRDVAKAIGGDRVILAQEQPAALAKNRLGLSSKLPLSMEWYREHLCAS